ncbi:MAG: hypothetical protein OJF62_001068 [Pseudolabrys sp.]|jgi:uncharacterized protein GlcG (DUF336 family)|nr:hypothetical protein [Pseudolabrys sp.]
MKRFALIVAMLLAIPAAGHADSALVTYKSIAPDTALELAEAALKKCRADGYQVAVIVLDRFGAPLVGLRDRYASLGAWDIATGKAWTAINFGRDTSVLIKDGNITPALARAPRVMLSAGGVIIEAAGSIIGGVGVAGAPGGDKDEACAKAGLDAVRDKLDF